jgi:hypothetical protein
MNTIQRLIRESKNEKSKLNQSKSRKLKNGSKMPQKFRKMKQELQRRTTCHMY